MDGRQLQVAAARACIYAGVAQTLFGLVAWFAYSTDPIWVIDDLWLMIWFAGAALFLSGKVIRVATLCALLAATYAQAPLFEAGYTSGGWSVGVLTPAAVLWFALDRPSPIKENRGVVKALIGISVLIGIGSIVRLIPAETSWLMVTVTGAPALFLLVYRLRRVSDLSRTDATVAIALIPVTAWLVLYLFLYLAFPLAAEWLGDLLLVHWAVNLWISWLPVGAIITQLHRRKMAHG